MRRNRSGERTPKTLLRIGLTSGWSFCSSLGYNVNQKENLSPNERRVILDFAITNGFKTQKEAIGFLQWLIDYNGSR